MENSLGIIGGADGPTAIFVSTSMGTPLDFKALLISVIAILLAYFIGNISPATLLAKAKGIDIKKEGSGNAGTTNVLRVLGKKAAIITLIIDIAKGVIAVFVGRVAGYLYAGSAIETMRMTAKLQDIGVEFNEELELAITSSWMTSLAMACGLFAFIGHIWPLIFKFKGGKGVATAFGVLVALNPLLGIFTLLVVALVVAVSGMVSLGSVCGAISLPIIAYFIMPEFVIMGCIMAIIVIIKHRQNIGRIIKGEESKLFHKK